MDLLKDSVEKVRFIQDKLMESQSRQKDYTYRKVCDMHFMDGEQVLLKVSPIKGVMQFWKKGKLSPIYIEPFDILKCLGSIIYKLALHPCFLGVYPVFHVSILKKYYGDDDYIIHLDFVLLDENLSYESRN